MKNFFFILLLTKGIIFVEFNTFWINNEMNVMSFERFSKIFIAMIRDKLTTDPSCIIRENFLGKIYKLNQF
jgi:hypothetical protein